jgi:hypothetical protein
LDTVIQTSTDRGRKLTSLLKQFYKIDLASVAGEIHMLSVVKYRLPSLKICAVQRPKYTIETCSKRVQFYTPLFWNGVICSSVVMYKVFEGMYSHHLQRRRYSPRYWHLTIKLHSVTSYKTEMFIPTAVLTSDLIPTTECLLFCCLGGIKNKTQREIMDSLSPVILAFVIQFAISQIYTEKQ